jgi:neopullulanase
MTELLEYSRGICSGFRGFLVLRLCVVTLALSIAGLAQTPIVEKVEPPNWWPGHSINPLRVIVRGANFQNGRVASKNGALRVSNLRLNQRGDYLFFDLSIGATVKPGKYTFDLVSGGRTTPIPFEISAPLPKAGNFQGVNNDDVIYLIMTDRFADGDQANNKDVERKNPRAWHGGDFRGIVSKLDYLKELGITTIWLTPWYDNPDEANQCDKPWCPNTNYHGYHAIDYYGVENHFGTMADLQLLVREAHKKGIKIVQDQVANHVGIQHPWAKKPPLENWFSQFSANTFNNSVLLSPNASQAERDNLLKGWFNELLPDLNQTEPEVSRYLIQNALWWIGMTGIDGIRQDTIQYMPREFIRGWSAAILKQYPKYYMVGEVFEEDSAQTAFFQGGRKGWDGIDTNLPSVFDFKLWRTSQEVFTGKKPARALRDVLKYDGLYPSIDNVTTLTNNHDTDRFMSLPGATLEGAMLHAAFILSTRGIPQLYYGEEIAMTGGHDPDNRKDFPGGFAGDTRDAFTKSGRTTVEEKMFDWTREWIKIRRSRPAVMQGRTLDLYYDNDSYVYVRGADAGTKLGGTVFAFNTSNNEKTVSFISPFVKGGRLISIQLKPKSARAFGELLH